MWAGKAIARQPLPWCWVLENVATLLLQLLGWALHFHPEVPPWQRFLTVGGKIEHTHAIASLWVEELTIWMRLWCDCDKLAEWHKLLLASSCKPARKPKGAKRLADPEMPMLQRHCSKKTTLVTCVFHFALEIYCATKRLSEPVRHPPSFRRRCLFLSASFSDLKLPGPLHFFLSVLVHLKLPWASALAGGCLVGGFLRRLSLHVHWRAQSHW